MIYRGRSCSRRGCRTGSTSRTSSAARSRDCSLSPSLPLSLSPSLSPYHYPSVSSYFSSIPQSVCCSKLVYIVEGLSISLLASVPLSLMPPPLMCLSLSLSLSRPSHLPSRPLLRYAVPSKRKYCNSENNINIQR